MYHNEWLMLIIKMFLFSVLGAMTIDAFAQAEDKSYYLIINSIDEKLAHKIELETREKEKGNVLLIGYRRYLSPQFSADCAFDLSCSRFSSKAIQRKGFFIGVLLTADRLSRCHTFVAQETVPIFFNNKTGKVIDEPDMY